MNGGRIKNGRGVVLRFLQHTHQMALGLESSLTPGFPSGRTGLSPAPQSITSVEDCKQVGGDVINGSITVYPMKKAAFIVPGCKWSRLFVIGPQAIEHRVFVIVCPSLFLIVSTNTAVFWNGVERIMVDGSAETAG